MSEPAPVPAVVFCTVRGMATPAVVVPVEKGTMYVPIAAPVAQRILFTSVSLLMIGTSAVTPPPSAVAFAFGLASIHI